MDKEGFQKKNIINGLFFLGRQADKLQVLASYHSATHDISLLYLIIRVLVLSSSVLGYFQRYLLAVFH